MTKAGVASVDALGEAFGELRRALDTHDAAAIHAATRKVEAATSAVQAQGAWKMDPELREKLQALVPMIESARVRVNLATDNVRQRLSMLAENGTQGATGLTYGR